jgi:hypothetical protein
MEAIANRTEYDILKNKLGARIEHGRTLGQGALKDLLDQGSLLEDYLVPLQKLDYLMDAEQRVLLSFSNKEGVVAANMHDNAISQLSSRLDLPPAFMRELLNGEDWKRNIGRDTLDKFTQHARNTNVLVRKVGGQARAVLSDKYRRMNNLPVFTSFVKGATGQGAQLYDGHVGDLRAFVEVMMPDIFEVHTPKNGTVCAAMGAQISSSDFGNGSLEVRAYLLQVRCLNGMVSTSVVREIHLGKRMSEADFAFSAETYAKDTETMVSAVGDITSTIFTPQYRDKLVAQVIGASAVDTTLEQEVKQLPKLGVQKEEVEAVMELLARSSPDDGVQGDMTAWKVTQALTAHARNAEPVRMRELQHIAGKMLEQFA